MELHGKVVVVTGASGGIGEAVARDLGAQGCRLVVTARSEDKLRALCDGLGDATFVAGDATDETLPRRLLDHALDRFGAADVLVNNAGVMSVGSIADTDIDQVCAMVRLNVEAAVRFAYTFLKHFTAHDSGYLVNTSSVAGSMVPPLGGVYAGTKHAIEAFSEALWNELAGTGVGVGVIAPGTVATGLYDEWKQDDRAWVHGRGALQPDDVAAGVRYLLGQSDRVRVVRLQVLPAGNAST